MNSSQLNRRVSIQQKTITVDSTYGTQTVSWATLETVWAEVQDVLPSKAESVRLGMQVARDQTRIRMRYRSDITPAMRVIVHGDSDVVMQIVGGPAEVGGRQRGIELMCERYSTAGTA